MMNVVIVDDEKIIRDGLRDVVDWKSLNLNVVFCACNGKEALDYISDNPVDILLTDIRMPKIDGLELLHFLSELPDPPVSIILSGFSDFRYAQRAIKYGILNYLLKPIRPQELHDTLKSAAEKRALRTVCAPDTEQYAKYLTEDRASVYNFCDAIANAVSQSDLQSAENLCGELRDLFLNGQYAVELFRKHVFRCIYQCVQASEYSLGIDINYFDNLISFEQLSAAGSHQEVFLHLTQHIKNICICINEAQAARGKKVVSEAVSIIAHRYGDENLSIASIADKLGLTPNYLSALFKRQTGHSFSEHLERCRMEKAKLLLSDVRYKVYEVAAMVGYGDTRHFGKTFKANFGQTPLDFRNTVLSSKYK